MIEKPVSELKIKYTKNPILSVEVDLDSIPKEFSGHTDIVVEALESIAPVLPKTIATVYVYCGNSVNFDNLQTWSAFIGVVGPRKILDSIFETFKNIPGAKVKLNGYIYLRDALCEFHMQDGIVWRPLDKLTWFTKPIIKNQEPENKKIEKKVNGEILETVSVAENELPVSNAIRFRAARSDATIGTIKQKIEEVFGLPEGSVTLCGPDGKSLRADTLISTLRKRWE
jgi:hypothetical protein